MRDACLIAAPNPTVYEITINGYYGEDDTTILDRYERQRGIIERSLAESICPGLDQGQEEARWCRCSG